MATVHRFRRWLYLRSLCLYGASEKGVARVGGPPDGVYLGTRGNPNRQVLLAKQKLGMRFGLLVLGAGSLVAQVPVSAIHVGAETGLLTSRDGGRFWQVNPALGSRNVLAVGIDPTNTDRLFAATAGQLHRSIDAGATWETFEVPWESAVRGIIVDPAREQRLYAVGNDLWRSNDGGKTWMWLTAAPAEIRTFKVDPLAPTILFASTLLGLFRSGDSGETWQVVDKTVTDFGIEVVKGNTDLITMDTDYIRSDDAGFLRRSRDGGKTWQRFGPEVTSEALAKLVTFSFSGDLRAAWPDIILHELGTDPNLPGSYYAVVTTCYAFPGYCAMGLLSYVGGIWRGSLMEAGDMYVAAAMAADGTIYAATRIAVHRTRIADNGWIMVRQASSRSPALAVDPLHTRLKAMRNAATPGGQGLLAPGSLISLFGERLAESFASADQIPLPKELAGTDVLVDGTPIGLHFVGPRQINAVLPSTLPSSEVSVEVRVGGRRSVPLMTAIARSAPALFTVDSSGSGPGLVFHGATFRPVSSQDPALSGEVVVVYGTGLGVAQSVFATIGDLNVRPDYAGPAPGFEGVFQLNIRLPDNLTAGSHSLRVTADGVSSNPVQLFSF